MTDAPASETPDLFALPPEDLARPVGLIEGPDRWDEGFGADLRVWCGPLVGWRDFGDLVGRRPVVGSLVRHQRRLSISITFDLGEHVLPRALRDRIEQQEESDEAAVNNPVDEGEPET